MTSNDWKTSLKDYFIKTVEKKNYIPTTDELILYCKNKLNISIKSKDIVKFRRQYKPIALYTQSLRKPKLTSGYCFPKYGTIQIDLAFFKPKWKGFNQGFHIFLVVVECLSQRIAARPIKSKTSENIETALENILFNELTDIHLVLSDRETAVVSKKFCDKMRKNFNIEVAFLKRLHKSYKAERAIRSIKSNLTQLCQLKETKRWIDLLQGVVSALNKKQAFGSKLKRSQVNKMNYLDVLDSYYNSQDGTLLQNVNEARSLNESVKKKLFKYQIGDRVFLSRRGDYNVKEQGSFLKPSEKGYFSATPYTIQDLLLKSNKGYYVKVYKLKKLSGLYYEDELISANPPKYDSVVERNENPTQSEVR